MSALHAIAGAADGTDRSHRLTMQQLLGDYVKSCLSTAREGELSVLVVDKVALSIINACMTISEVVALGFRSVVTLETWKEHVSGERRPRLFPVPAVYFVRATTKNLAMILDDFASHDASAALEPEDLFERCFPCIFHNMDLPHVEPTYGAARLLFIPGAPRVSLSGPDANSTAALRRIVEESKQQKRYRRMLEYLKLQDPVEPPECILEALPEDEYVFSIQMPQLLPQLYTSERRSDPGVKDAIKATLRLIAYRLLSVCVALNEFPEIRWRNSDAGQLRGISKHPMAELVAVYLRDMLIEYKESHPAWRPTSWRSDGSPRSPPPRGARGDAEDDDDEDGEGEGDEDGRGRGRGRGRGGGKGKGRGGGDEDEDEEEGEGEEEEEDEDEDHHDDGDDDDDEDGGAWRKKKAAKAAAAARRRAAKKGKKGGKARRETVEEALDLDAGVSASAMQHSEPSGPATLLIMERVDDLVTALAHDWSYEAALTDVLGYEHGEPFPVRRVRQGNKLWKYVRFDASDVVWDKVRNLDLEDAEAVVRAGYLVTVQKDKQHKAMSAAGDVKGLHAFMLKQNEGGKVWDARYIVHETVLESLADSVVREAPREGDPADEGDGGKGGGFTLARAFGFGGGGGGGGGGGDAGKGLDLFQVAAVEQLLATGVFHDQTTWSDDKVRDELARMLRQPTLQPDEKLRLLILWHVTRNAVTYDDRRALMTAAGLSPEDLVPFLALANLGIPMDRANSARIGGLVPVYTKHQAKELAKAAGALKRPGRTYHEPVIVSAVRRLVPAATMDPPPGPGQSTLDETEWPFALGPHMPEASDRRPGRRGGGTGPAGVTLRLDEFAGAVGGGGGAGTVGGVAASVVDAAVAAAGRALGQSARRRKAGDAGDAAGGAAAAGGGAAGGGAAGDAGDDDDPEKGARTKVAKAKLTAHQLQPKPKFHGRRIIAFFLGGVSPAETTALARLRAATGIEIIVGTTSIVAPRDVLADLAATESVAEAADDDDDAAAAAAVDLDEEQGMRRKQTNSKKKKKKPAAAAGRGRDDGDAGSGSDDARDADEQDQDQAASSKPAAAAKRGAGAGAGAGRAANGGKPARAGASPPAAAAATAAAPRRAAAAADKPKPARPRVDSDE